jgi:hypothetical protein
MSGCHKQTTLPDNMLSDHRRYPSWTLDRIRGMVTLLAERLVRCLRRHVSNGRLRL